MCMPSGLSLPCWRAVGFQCGPALAKAGGSQRPTAWRWTPYVPGTRPAASTRTRSEWPAGRTAARATTRPSGVFIGAKAAVGTAAPPTAPESRAAHPARAAAAAKAAMSRVSFISPPPRRRESSGAPRRSADAVPPQPGLLHLLRRIDVPQVDEYRLRHGPREPLEVQRPQHVPFRDQHHRVGTGRRGVRVVEELDPLHQRPRLLDSLRIVTAHVRACVLEGLDDADRRRVAHVVGVRLEGEAEDRHRPSPPFAAERLDDLAAHRALARIVDLDDALDDPERRPLILGGLEQGERILREAGAAIAGAGMKEFRPDPVVEADAAGDVLDVGADHLAQIGDLVDEGDLGRQEGVRRIFGELGRP